MKKTILFFVAAFVVLVHHAQTVNTAVGYLNFLNKQSEAVTKDMWDYTSSIARSRSAKSIDMRRSELMKQIQTSKAAVEAKPAFDNQDYIKNAFIKYLDIHYILLNEDYAKIIDMEAVAEQSYDDMEAYIMVQDQANEKMRATSDELHAEVEKYAAENKIILSDEMSQTGQKLERASKAFDYYQPIFLNFFKSNIQENNFMKALNASDFAGAEQARVALVATATEGLEKANSYDSYNGDSSIKSECVSILRFYLDEASDDFVKMLDFYAKKETFEKQDAAMKAKKKSEITKADNDAFNKAVSEYNAAVKTYNTVNNSLNTKRARAIDDWNKKVQAFLMKHAA